MEQRVRKFPLRVLSETAAVVVVRNYQGAGSCMNTNQLEVHQRETAKGSLPGAAARLKGIPRDEPHKGT